MGTDYSEQCHCGHSRGAHSYDANEDSIICDECECAGFDTKPPEPYVPDEQDFDISEGA